MSELVRIDGSVMEGGGQLLRMAVSLASLLCKPIEIFNIRGKRSKPGLMAQHLQGIKLVSQMTKGSSLIGAELNSKTVKFIPGSNDISESEFLADTKTAGAVCLLAQISLPKATFLLNPVKLTLKGGTNAEMAPTVEYYTHVFLPTLKRFGIDVQMDVIRKGYFPQGGGVVHFNIKPVDKLNPIILDVPCKKITEVVIYSSVAGRVPLKVAEVMASSASGLLKQKLPETVPVKVETFVERNAYGNGGSITIIGRKSDGSVFGGSAISSPKLDPRNVGVKAAEDLLNSLLLDVCVDSHLQDQLILYMALACGRSRIRTTSVTLHTRTGIHIAQLLTSATFSILEEEQDQSVSVIECSGVGYYNKQLQQPPAF